MNEKLDYCILLSTSSQASFRIEAALEFCKDLLSSGNKIHTLFLQSDAVNLAGTMNVIPEEEGDMAAKWQAFVANNQLNAHVCTNSSLRRGVLNKSMAEQYKKNCTTLSPLFQLSPLGVLFDSMQVAHRFVQL